jgi:regulator of protease activity HflC (stomatin/prohibitin superfamily)
MDLSNIFQIAAAAGAGLASLWYLSSTLFTVDQKEEALITSFGKHIRTEKNPGLHMKAPWPFNVVEDKISTALHQVGDTLDTKTKDNLFVGLPITIQYEVNNTGRYYFDNNEPIEQMAKIVSAAVRKYTSGKDFQELYDERDEISVAVIAEVKDQIDDYGVNIRRIVIDEPKAPSDVQNAYNRVRSSERERDAALNEAEAEKIRIVKKAEADKERNILIGEGVAGFRKKIFDQYAEQIQELVTKGVTREDAEHMMLEAMRLDTLRDIGDKGNMVIVSPDATTGKSIAEMQTLTQTLDKGPKVSDTRKPANEQRIAPGPV